MIFFQNVFYTQKAKEINPVYVRIVFNAQTLWDLLNNKMEFCMIEKVNN